MGTELVRLSDVQLSVERQGSGPPLLLVHGFPLDRTMWKGQLDGLADRFELIAPDLRGFGDSEFSSDTVTMEQFADDLAGMLDAISVRDPVTFCGLSMGGYIAWQFFLRYRQRLERLVLCDTRAAADSKEAAAGRLATADRVLREGSSVVSEAMVSKLFSESTAALRGDVVAQTREVMDSTAPAAIAAALRGMAQRVDMTHRLQEIDVPTLVICGSEDPISPVAEMRDIADAIKGARFVEVPHSGHMAPLEAPDIVNQAIRDFAQ